METSEQKIYELWEAAEQMEHGNARMDMYEQAIQLADREKLLELQINIRLDAIQEDTFYLDSLKSFVMYPVLLKLVDQYWEERGTDPQRMHEVLWDYKWILGSASEFYQVTRQQFDDMAQDCIRRYKENGYSPRPVYSHMFAYYEDIDIKLAKNYYNEYLRQRWDSMSNCLGCEKSREVKFLLKYGWETEAIQKANSIFRGESSCEIQPGAVCANLIDHIVCQKIRGRMVNEELEGHAAEYAEQVRSFIVRKHRLTGDIGNLLMYYCVYEPNKALGWMKKYCDFAETYQEPDAVLHFALGMLLFLDRIQEKKQVEHPVYRMKLDARFRFYNEAGVYDVGELYAYYDAMAREIVEKFEKSQGRKHLVKLYEAVKGYRAL